MAVSLAWCLLLLACMGLSRIKYVAVGRCERDGRLLGFVGGFRGRWARLYQKVMLPRLLPPPGEIFVDALWGVVPGASFEVAAELMKQSRRSEALRQGATTVITTSKRSGTQRMVDSMARRSGLSVEKREFGQRCAYPREWPRGPASAEGRPGGPATGA